MLVEVTYTLGDIFGNLRDQYTKTFKIIFASLNKKFLQGTYSNILVKGLKVKIQIFKKQCVCVCNTCTVKN